MFKSILLNWRKEALIIVKQVIMVVLVTPTLCYGEIEQSLSETQLLVQDNQLLNVAPATNFDDISNKLIDAKLKTIPSVVDELVASVKTPEQQDVAFKLMQGMLEGKLYYLKEDSSLVLAHKNSDGDYDLYEIENNALLKQAVSKKTIKKVKTSNSVRKFLRTAIAKFQLESGTIEQRIQSVQNLMAKVDAPCLLYTSPSPRDQRGSRMPSSA